MKFSYFLAAMIIFLAISSTIAQNESSCSTIGGGSDAVGALPASVTETTNPGPYYFRVYVHVTRREDGTGGISDQDVDAVFDRLNNDFNPHNIFFLRHCDIIDIILSDENYVNFDVYCSLWNNPEYQHDNGLL